jgi:hypothetical protein
VIGFYMRIYRTQSGAVMTSKQNRLCFALVEFALVCLVSPWAFADGLSDQDAHDFGSIPDGLIWSDLDSGTRPQILDLLSVQTKSNYEKMRTWKGVYSVRLTQHLPETYADRMLAKDIPARKVGAIKQQVDFSLKFAVDIASAAIYRNKETSKMIFTTVDSGKPIKLPNVIPADQRSVVTPEFYIFFQPKNVFTSSHLSDHPQAQNKRAAFCLPAENARNQHIGDLIHPCSYFRFDSGVGRYFWEIVGGHAKALRGEYGETKKSSIGQRMQLSQAQGDDGGMWYRYRFKFGSNGGPTMTTTSIWRSRAGFNPVSYVVMSDSMTDRLSSKTEWSWKKIEGIDVPSRVKEIRFDATSGKLTYERDAELINCELNKPLDTRQFDYQGLGLQDGDLVLNEIEHVAYQLHGGSLVKLASYGETGIRP